MRAGRGLDSQVAYGRLVIEGPHTMESPEPSNFARLEVLISTSSFELLGKAAKIEGRSLNDFAAAAVCDAAGKVIPQTGRRPDVHPRPSELDSLNARETRWLARNRYLYAGQWIALEGDLLLATGATGAEVYEKVRERATPPLVMLIEKEDQPFAGW